MADKILFFGTTGMEKKSVLDGFKEWCETLRGHRCKVYDFEAEFLRPSLTKTNRSYLQFLDGELNEQRAQWQLAWKDFRKELGEYERKNRDHKIFIGVHGCFIRSYYGARVICGIEQLAAIKPQRIVTLLDNVYDLWWRTEERAGGYDLVGRPTLEHLLFARRVEAIAADQVAHAGSIRVPHLIISVHHPCETLWNWIYGPRKNVIYLSFPISDPRRMLEKGDKGGQAAINDFVKEAYQWQRQNPDRVVLCPLTIDELPLSRGFLRLKKENESLKDWLFDREALTWDLASVFNSDEVLSRVLSAGPPRARTNIPGRQIEHAAGMIESDVGWRDYRLIDQANSVAAFCPHLDAVRSDISEGVRAEIGYASSWRKVPVYLYQDPSRDPNKVVESLFPRIDPGASTGRPPGDQRVRYLNSVHELFQAIANLPW